MTSIENRVDNIFNKLSSNGELNDDMLCNNVDRYPFQSKMKGNSYATYNSNDLSELNIVKTSFDRIKFRNTSSYNTVYFKECIFNSTEGSIELESVKFENCWFNINKPMYFQNCYFKNNINIPNLFYNPVEFEKCFFNRMTILLTKDVLENIQKCSFLGCKVIIQFTDSTDLFLIQSYLKKKNFFDKLYLVDGSIQELKGKTIDIIKYFDIDIYNDFSIRSKLYKVLMNDKLLNDIVETMNNTEYKSIGKNSLKRIIKDMVDSGQI